MRLKYIIAAVLALVGVILGIYNWVNYFKTQAQLPKPAIQAVRPPPRETHTQQEKQKTQAGVQSNRNIRVRGTLAAGSKILLQLPDTVGRNPFLTPEEIEAIARGETFEEPEPEPAPVPAAVVLPELELTGVIQDNLTGDFRAIIGGQIYNRGDKVGVEEIVEITRGSVVLQYQGNMRSISLKEGNSEEKGTVKIRLKKTP